MFSGKKLSPAVRRRAHKKEEKMNMPLVQVKSFNLKTWLTTADHP